MGAAFTAILVNYIPKVAVLDYARNILLGRIFLIPNKVRKCSL